MTYKLIVSKSAAAAFGKSLGANAVAQREFCIRVVEEVLAAPLQIEAIFEAVKSAAGYDAFELDSEKALLRKQLSYVRQIVGAWPSLDCEQHVQFTGGGLPASALVKLINAPKAGGRKAAKEAKEKAEKAEKEAREKAERKAAGRVVTPEEMMVHVAAMLDTKPLSRFTKAQSKAYAILRDAMAASEAAFLAEASTTLEAKAA